MVGKYKVVTLCGNDAGTSNIVFPLNRNAQMKCKSQTEPAS